MGYLGRIVCAYCLLKDDMPFVSGSYMIEVNDYIEKSVLFSTLIRLRICVITQLKYEKTQLITIW